MMPEAIFRGGWKRKKKGEKRETNDGCFKKENFLLRKMHFTRRTISAEDGVNN